MKIQFLSVVSAVLLGSFGMSVISPSASAFDPKFSRLRLVTPRATLPPVAPASVLPAVLPTQLPPILETAYFQEVAAHNYLSPMEQAIIAETNRLRMDPAGYADELALYEAYFNGLRLELPGLPPIETYEGFAVVEEAIAVLRETEPLLPLRSSAGMSLAASDHVTDMSITGESGHYGTDGSTPFERLNRYGQWDGSPGNRAGENLSYSPVTLDNPFDLARWHVLQLVVDDGFPNRGHREAILRPDYRVTGVACGDHPLYGLMCSMTYATEYREAETGGSKVRLPKGAGSEE